MLKTMKHIFIAPLGILANALDLLYSLLATEKLEVIARDKNGGNRVGAVVLRWEPRRWNPSKNELIDIEFVVRTEIAKISYEDLSTPESIQEWNIGLMQRFLEVSENVSFKSINILPPVKEPFITQILDSSGSMGPPSWHQPS